MISYVIVPIWANLRFSFPIIWGKILWFSLSFFDAWEQGVWRDIRSVEVIVWFPGSARGDKNDFFSQISGHQQHYEKCWKEFKVTVGDYNRVIVRASMWMVLCNCRPDPRPSQFLVRLFACIFALLPTNKHLPLVFPSSDFVDKYPNRPFGTWCGYRFANLQLCG